MIVAAVLGFLAAASFWLGYFDFASGGVRDLLAKRRGSERIAFARDAYTYAHLPMVVGIVLFAFGVRTTLAYVGADLGLIPTLALCCGPALYVLGSSRSAGEPRARLDGAAQRPPPGSRSSPPPDPRAGPRRTRARHGRMGRAALI